MSIELHDHEEVIWQGRTSWRGLYAFWLKWLPLTTAPLTIPILLVLFGVIDNPPGGWATLFGISVFLSTIVAISAWFKRIYTLYTVTSHRLNINSGILGKKNQNCRLDRIQNGNCEQSLIQRMLDVGDIEIETAGNDESDFVFMGIISPNKLIAKIELAQEDRATDNIRKDPL